MGVVFEIDGRKRTVASEKAEPALGNGGIPASPLPLPEPDTDSMDGKG